MSNKNEKETTHDDSISIDLISSIPYISGEVIANMLKARVTNSSSSKKIEPPTTKIQEEINSCISIPTMMSICQQSKLTMKNFHSWNHDFLINLDGIPQAISLLTTGHPFSSNLNSSLINCLMSSCQLDGENGIRHLILKKKDGYKFLTAHSFYSTLKKELTKNDQEEMDLILSRLENIKLQDDFDVRKMINEIQELSINALEINQELSHLDLLNVVKNQVSKHPIYSKVLDELSGEEEDYQTITTALLKKQDELEIFRNTKLPSSSNRRESICWRVSFQNKLGGGGGAKIVHNQITDLK